MSDTVEKGLAACQCTVKNEEFLELLELAIYSFVIVTNTPGSSNELQLLLDRV